MSRRGKDTTAAIIDGVLKFVAAGGLITTAILAPNAVQTLDKPLAALAKKLDKRQAGRELRRVVYYMKQQGLIAYEPRNYDHGIKLTASGKKRLRQRDTVNRQIPKPDKWDKMWRLVFFDIPEEMRSRRNTLTSRLKSLGYQQLQYSIWIHPFPSRAEVEALSEHLEIRQFVTYVEIFDIDAKEELLIRFKKILR